MKKWRIDLHVHSRFSADSVADPEAIIAAARARGLHGFAITDHNTSECAAFFAEKGLLDPGGAAVDDFLILPGQEITTAEGHLLAIGVSLPNMKGIPAREAVAEIHRLGGLAIPPHPYDFFRAGIREPVLKTLDLDAIEVFNAASTLRHYNRQAFVYASRHRLAMTAGSDAHHPEAVGVAFTILQSPALNLAGILQAIRQGGERNERYLSARDAFRKTWSNLIRLRRPPIRRIHRKKSAKP